MKFFYQSILILFFQISFSPCLYAFEEADYVLNNGEIYTVNSNRSWAKAIAIKDDKIIFVGDNKGAAQYITKKTTVIDLKNKMLLPGFQDSHIHPLSSALKTYSCSLYDLPSVEAYLARIKECVAKNPDTTWLHGAGWSHQKFQLQKPDKALLDKITTDIPVTFYSYDGHSLWANSEALRLAGVDSNTKDITSGKIIRYVDSTEPTGLFLEDPAMSLVMKAKPQYTSAQLRDALIYVQQYLNSLGITSVQDALLRIGGKGGIYDIIDTYHQADLAGELSLRVTAALYWDPTKGMEQVTKMKQYRTKYTHDKFRVTSVKIWQDGVMHTHTSRLLEAYLDQPDEYGLVMIPPERLNKLVIALDEAGFQMHFHADGDGAIRQCLNAVEQAISINGRLGNRHQIAHLELIHPSDIPRFRELDVIANVQPLWSTSKTYISDLINVKIGQERKRWLEINKSFLEQGIHVAYGSDWSVTTPNPMELIEAAVTRIRPALSYQEKKQSKALLPEEAVSLADAISSYTIQGAYVNQQEKTTGSIEVGKLADLVVLEKNLFDVEPLRISETKVLLTFMNGQIVYGQLPLD